jgi:hypothetical protein
MVPNCGTLSSIFVDVGRDMDTMFVGKSYANMHMTLALNEFQAASRKGGCVGRDPQVARDGAERPGSVHGC